MKFNSILRSSLVAATSLALGLGTLSCSRDYTVAYVYAISGQTGVVSAYGVDYQSGILTQISGSPFASQLGNPVTVVAAPSGKTIYVVGGSQNAQIEPFSVGTDGKLYGITGAQMSGNTYPTAAAVDSTGSFLFVTFTYEQPYGPASPGPGGVMVFKINADGSLGSPVANGSNSYFATGNNPIAVGVSAPQVGTKNVYVYVVDKEGSSYSAGAQPTVMGFQLNTTSGALTLLSGTTYNSTLKTYQGTNVGVTPSAIAIDPTARYVYVTDKSSNEIYGYAIGGTASPGNLTPLTTSPYATGLYPVGITIDPRGKYLYTANYNANTVSAYTINSPDGSLSGSGVGNFTTSTGPTCVTIEPALGIFLFTSNYIDNSLSAAQLSPNTGQLTAVANTPFVTASEPTCVVAVPNGSHSTSIDNP